ncbi:MAG: elongation factor G, partial [Caulobacteraceae bacterium]
GQAGLLAYARVLGGRLAGGGELTLPDGEPNRVGGLFLVQGPAQTKVGAVADGEVAALGKLDHVRAGQVLSLEGETLASPPGLQVRPPVHWVAISPRSRNDDVRISDALARLIEEDPALSLTHDPDTHETVMAGQGEGHLRLALSRLKSRFGLEVATAPPSTPYKETISTAVQQHARHKKQTGGHGQFADITLEIRPLPRGEGFAFASRITGGVVPRQWIPAVEQGVLDAMAKGPLGFAVTDVAVALTDGGFHAVDSSEMAFRLAGRLAMDEALRRAGACLLEPVEKVVIDLPATCTSNAISTLSARRGQVLGFGPRPEWTGWDRIEAYLPRAERYDLNGELRSLSQGLATFTHGFDHMSELTGRLRDEATQRARSYA